MRDETPDESLISETLEGDEEAFAQLVSRHKSRIFGLAARFARDGAELEDICQDVFIKAYENLKTFRHDAPFGHWLARITVRTCYDLLRKRKKDDRYVQLDNLAFRIGDDSLEARQAAEQAREFIQWGLSKLRPEERMVISLLELEEKSVCEIAELTGWSESNVKVRAYRARRELKRILEENHDG